MTDTIRCATCGSQIDVSAVNEAIAAERKAGEEAERGTTNTCGTCRYRGVPANECEMGRIEDGGKQCTYFLCGRIEQKPNYWVYPAGKKAMVKDGSGYYAALCVETDFGCSLWEAK